MFHRIQKKEEPIINLVERCLLPVNDPNICTTDITKAVRDVADLYALQKFNTGVLQQPCVTLNKHHIRTVLSYDKGMQALLVPNEQYLGWLVNILLYAQSLDKWKATFQYEENECTVKYLYGLLFKDNQLLLPICCVLSFCD
tara:strand:- start:47 stop:472 length:426 start_codon:yes stop_codon:yes gene_type:complete